MAQTQKEILQKNYRETFNFSSKIIAKKYRDEIYILVDERILNVHIYSNFNFYGVRWEMMEHHFETEEMPLMREEFLELLQNMI